MVPIDGSKPRYESFQKALELAKIHGFEVEILHVMIFKEDVPDDSRTNNGCLCPEYVENYLSEVRKNDEKMLKNAQNHAITMIPDN